MSRPSTVLNRCATEAEDARAYNAVLAFIRPVSAPIGSTPSIMWESMISPVGESTKMTMDWFPGCAFCQSTQALTIALAVSALITAFIKVRLATSSDTVTLLNGAGVAPCAQALALPNANVAVAIARITAARNNTDCFLISFSPSCHRDLFFYGRFARVPERRFECSKYFPHWNSRQRNSTPTRLNFAKFLNCLRDSLGADKCPHKKLRLFSDLQKFNGAEHRFRARIRIFGGGRNGIIFH